MAIVLAVELGGIGITRDATHSESTSLWQPTQSQLLFETLGTHMLNLDASSSYLLKVHLDFIISDRAVYFML
jgi:hypothetical protein